jgi:hypothetical protein
MSGNQPYKKAQARRSTTVASLGVDSDRVHQLAQQHGLEVNTRKAYSSHLNRARTWIAEAAKEAEKLAELKPPILIELGDSSEVFASAFGETPNRYSPHAVALYLTHLHIDRNLGKSSLEQAHAALKNMWNNV